MHCMYLLTIYLVTHSFTHPKSKASLAPIPAGSSSDSIVAIKILCDWVTDPSASPHSPALRAGSLSHLLDKTSCFVLPSLVLH